jgi:hypothetical protein
MGFVAGEVEDAVAVNEVEEGVREGCGFERFGAEVVCWEMRRESGGEGAGLLDGGRVMVDSEDLVAFAEEIDEIAAGAAAGIEDTHAGDDVAAEEMVEEIDVDEAELFLQIGHRATASYGRELEYRSGRKWEKLWWTICNCVTKGVRGCVILRARAVDQRCIDWAKER